ncbi:MAG: FxLYD domain-containing protein [Candidatus Xenobia bacterium]
MRNKHVLIFLLGLLVGPVLADAPRQLSIILNQRPYAGKAIWYKNEIYVPLKDVVRNMGGTFSYDHTTGVVNVQIGQIAPPQGGTRGDVNGPQSDATPTDVGGLVRVTWQNKVLYADNAKVTATFTNQGSGLAKNVQAVCVFKDDSGNVIGTSVQSLGNIAPGASRSKEFWLFDPSQSGVYPPPYGTTTGCGYGYVNPNVSMGQSPFDQIQVGTYRTSVQYDFKITYQ